MSRKPIEPRRSLIIGGPFYSLLGKLGLLGMDQLPAARAGVALAVLAWVVPAVLALIEYAVTGDAVGLAFLADPSALARFLVGVFICVAIEHRADARLSLILDNFRGAQLVSERDMPALTAAIVTADRRTSSRLAEFVFLAIALMVSGLIFNYAVRSDPLAWEGQLVDGAVVFSWPGLAARWVSAPLFQFLFLRWIWRFVAWGYLLFRISRLPLQLSATHPDRMGGLSFVSLYPPVFNGLTFAVSAAIAAALIRDLGFENISLQTVQTLVGVWIVLSVALMIGPLLVFMPRLVVLRDVAIIRYGRLAGELHREFERKWLEGDVNGKALLASSDASSAADTNATVAGIWGLRVVPVELSTVISVALAAGIPMLAVLATQMPLEVLANALLGVFL